MKARRPANVAPWIREALRAGFRHLERGEIDAASAVCQRILGARPDVVEAHFLVGLVATALKDRRNAIRAFGSVTSLEPEHAAAWAQLARLYNQSGRANRAEEALANAVRYDDGNPVVHDLVGAVYSALGDHPQALKWFASAASGAAHVAAYRVNHANCLMYLGRLDEAEAELRAVLRQHPGNPNAHWVLAGLRKATDYRHVDELRRLVGEKAWPDRAAAFLHYALGKELEDLEDWPNAFEAYAAGARARRKTLDYDERAEIETYAMLTHTFTEEWFEAQAEGTRDTSPIFVVGQPRTGTTLVERVITAHSAVHSAGELRQFGNAFRKLTNYGGAQRFSAALFDIAQTPVDWQRLGDMYLDSTAHLRGDTPRFVDKLPSNYLYLPAILKALPGAKIVHLRRNPMDACFASFKQLFADAYPHSYDQREMARHHARYLQLMDCWKARFGDRFFEIDYEAIASDLEPNARAVIEWLDLPWDPACLEFHRQDTAVTTASTVQVREPAHTRSIDRWRRYASQLEPMREELEKAGVPVDAC